MPANKWRELQCGERGTERSWEITPLLGLESKVPEAANFSSQMQLVRQWLPFRNGLLLPGRLLQLSEGQAVKSELSHT